MDVRWNSRFAELKRAKQLSSVSDYTDKDAVKVSSSQYNAYQAIDEYIKQLEAGKTGKKLAEAKKRRLRWYISPWEWESIEQLCCILEASVLPSISETR